MALEGLLDAKMSQVIFVEYLKTCGSKLVPILTFSVLAIEDFLSQRQASSNSAAVERAVHFLASTSLTQVRSKQQFPTDWHKFSNKPLALD